MQTSITATLLYGSARALLLYMLPYWYVFLVHHHEKEQSLHNVFTSPQIKMLLVTPVLFLL